MTDEQFDERISEAFAEVKLSKEAEDRILANLLAAESQKPDKWTGHLSEKPRKRGRVIRWAGPVAAAAALLVVALIGGILPSQSGGADKAAAPMEAMDTGAVNLSVEAAGEEEAVYSARAIDAETIVLADGSRYAISDAAADMGDPAGYAWQDATVEATGDPCSIAVLEDGTALVRFEGEDTCYLATQV